MRKVWLIGVFVFLGLILWQLWTTEPYFYYSAHDFFRQAQKALQQGDNVQALNYALKAHQREPQNLDFIGFLAWRYLEAKRPEEALPRFRQIRAARPSDATTLQGEALALQLLGKRAEALSLLAAYLSEHPQDRTFLQMAAEFTSAETEGQEQALEYYKRLYHLTPGDEVIRQRFLDLLIALGHFDAAIPLQEKVVADFPDNLQALHQLALLHAWRHDYDAALPLYQKLLELEADNQALRLEAAKNAEAAHDLDQALAYYLRLYAQSGGRKEYALTLARLWSQKGNHAEAAAVLSPLMDHQPGLEEQRRYALELLLSQDYAEALKVYRQVWEAGDTHKETIVNLARLLAAKQHFQPAARFWDEAGRRQLLDPELRREAALTYSYARRYGDAIAVLQPVDRRDDKMLLFLGQMHFYQQHWTQAAHYYQVYLARHPRDATVRQQLAQVLSFAPERLAEAAEQYENASQSTSDPRLRLQKAAVLLQLAQDLSYSADPAQRRRAAAHWAAAEAALQQVSADGLSSELLREQGRLFLWLGALEPALDCLERYLLQAPHDRVAQLEKARTLIYLQRGSEAAGILRRLPPEKKVRDSGMASFDPWKTTSSKFTSSPDFLPSKDGERAPEENSSDQERQTEHWAGQVSEVKSGSRIEPLNPKGRPPFRTTRPSAASKTAGAAEAGVDVLSLSLEAALADRNWPEAQRLAWRLYLTQLRSPSLPPRTWTAARRRLREEGTRQDLPPETRVLIARALCHHQNLEQEQEVIRVAVDLCVDNLYNRRHTLPSQRRTYQASLLLLEYLLPRLSHVDDLRTLMARLPGIRSQSPEYIAAVGYFNSSLGRQGGKLQYTLQALKDRQERYPARAPGDLIFLGSLASELGDRRTAVQYFEAALKLRPQDQRLATLRLQALMAVNDAGRVLKALEDQPQNPATALEMAKTYLQRCQYEGTLAILSGIAPNHPIWPQAQLFRLQAYRGLKAYPEALAAITELEANGQMSEAVLMAKGQVLEAMDDRRGAETAYQAAIAQAADTVVCRTAQARLARFRGDWAGAYRHFAAALQEHPQDIELLNELEQVRAQMRPTLGSRHLPVAWRGLRRPEEANRPWQFGRYDREPGVLGGSRSYPKSLLPVDFPYALIPEVSWLPGDRNRLRGVDVRLGGGFWLSRVLPVHLALGYRYCEQKTSGPGPANLNLGLNPVLSQQSANRTSWQRAEATLTLGPLILGDRVKLSGELSGRGYWKQFRQSVTQLGRLPIPFWPVLRSTDIIAKEDRYRLLGGLSVGLAPGPQTDLGLGYSRRDIFDQDPAIYPRLYQQVTRLDTLPLVTIHQVDLSLSHQLYPGLCWQANAGQAFFSDHNQRFSLYQGLRWQAVNESQMHLDLTPSYYLALYRQPHESYFSPHVYHALGVSLDFDRQIFRLPTLVLQTTGQVVDNDGRWGPALATLAGLEAEPLYNMYVGLYYFYFKEWATNYWLHHLTLGLRWRF
ncbi:tetratricopeptide repeat protein [Desulfobacca acetoxidans]